MAFDIGDHDTPSDLRKKWKRMCRCGVGWLVAGVLSVAVGIILMVFFVQYWNDSTRWERGLGYAGVALLCLGVLVFAVGLMLACILCFLVRNIENKRNYKPKVWNPDVKYPRQPVAGAGPTAPPPEAEAGHDNPVADIEAVEPQIKDKTF